MPRYLIIAGVDFGTSFTKVVLRDNNTPGSLARVVTFPQYPDGLLPSIVSLLDKAAAPPSQRPLGEKVPYLKMLAAHIAGGKSLVSADVQIPESVEVLCDSYAEREIIRGLLAFYFAHVMAATELFIRTKSPWQDFDFASGGRDILVYQLAVPTGMLADDGATERLFREAFTAAYDLRVFIPQPLEGTLPFDEVLERVATSLDEEETVRNTRFQWQCLLYPEVAAAVQTVFRTPNAPDGLYVTMDVGAGTVDLNTFRRFTGHQVLRRTGTPRIRNLDYYSAIVRPLGVQHLNDPHGAVHPRFESVLMEELRESLRALILRGQAIQPNLGHTQGHRTWDGAKLFIFGGGAIYPGYRHNFAEGLENTGIHSPQPMELPSSPDLDRPRTVDFGRFAVAYGLSFFRPSLDQVKLPHELAPFETLLAEQSDDTPPHEYGFNWDD